MSVSRLTGTEKRFKDFSKTNKDHKKANTNTGYLEHDLKPKYNPRLVMQTGKSNYLLKI